MTDLKKYDSQTVTRLIIGGILIVFIIGDGLIYFMYGSGAAGMGLLCLGAAMIPILIIMLVIWLMDWIVKRANKNS
jgi:TM2 domain-containing membrane protein YozV